MLLKDIEIEHLKECALGKGTLSLTPLVAYLQKILDKEGGRRHLLPWFGLEIIEGVSRSHGALNSSNMNAYEGVFEMVHALQEGLHLEEDGLWALGYPIPHHAFYGTSAFYAFVASDARQVTVKGTKPLLAPTEQLLYGVLLERFYGMPNSNDKLLYRINRDGIDQYYELRVDFSFVNIEKKGELYPIDLTNLHDKSEYCLADLEPLFRLLNFNNFTFEGFTILTFKETTTTYVSERIHTLMASLSDYKQERLFEELNQIMSTIAGSRTIFTSLVPVLELNGYPILSADFARNSVFFGELKKRKANGEIDPILTKYLEEPYSVVYGVDPSMDTNVPFFLEWIKRKGVASYISIPLKQRESLVGFIELYSYEPEQLGKESIMKWRIFIPLLTQLATELTGLFKKMLERIIMNNYTALNPAVEWRFNEVAARQVAAYMRDDEELPIESVRFENVYPIYGAIDVKGSTQLRNSIYKKDYLSKINHLREFLETLFATADNSLSSALADRVEQIRKKLEATNYEPHMLDVFLFLYEEMFHALEQIKKAQPTYGSAIDNFVAEAKAARSKRSDIFETSLQQLNKVVKDEVQHFNTAVQDVFPSYFELFRTDGVEYDMYVGQSITPTKVFEPSLLRTIRKLQIISMAHIGRRAAKLGPTLPVPMQITLLVFVHTSTIDISFRPDERRFDVEGGYNIRYQMVKKRIDKVRLKGSKERLVRPHTLAIVFQGESWRKEIMGLLEEVAAMGMLKPDFEFCTLEEVQGVSELEAIRADIILEEG